jgi:hypothetical protein
MLEVYLSTRFLILLSCFYEIKYLYSLKQFIELLTYIDVLFYK